MTAASPRRESYLRTLALIALLAMAMLWGSTFFSIKALVTRVPVPDMLAVRFTVAALVLAALSPRALRMSRRTLTHGVILGTLFGVAQLAQTFGLESTSASVSGFVTGLYVVFTPLIAAAVFRDRVPGLTWVAVGIATFGLALLSLNLEAGRLPLGPGELLTLASAVLFAGHIVATGHVARSDNALSLTIVQTVVCALICWVAAIPGGITLPQGWDWAWLLYLAIFCGALTMFLQMWAQVHLDATRAAVIMATEPVWAAGFAVVLGGEDPTWRMVGGGFTIVAAMILVILIPQILARRQRA